MSRLAILLSLMCCVGCSGEPEADAVSRGAGADVEDGGIVEHTDRDKAEAYFASLGKVESVEGERKLVTEFGAWLEKHDYKIRVEEIDGRHRLSCPYFPPVTPHTTHLFLDVENLKRLPQLGDGK